MVACYKVRKLNMKRETERNHKITIRITGLIYSCASTLWDGLFIQTQIKELYYLLALPNNVETLVVILSSPSEIMR